VLLPDAPADNRPTPTVIVYQLLAVVGLLLLSLGQFWQGLEIPNLFLAVFGVWMIFFPRPRVPILFATLFCLVQFAVHHDRYSTFRFTPMFTLFEPIDTAIAGGLLLFMGCQYRLIALKWHAAPHDPRFRYGKLHDDAGRAIAQFNRPNTAVRFDEIVRFLLVATLCVVAGQAEWGWLNQDRSFVEFSPRFVQVAFLVWFGVLAVFVVRGLAGAWRRAHADADESRLYLQEIAWQEARREYARIGRWMAWGKAKMKRKEQRAK
jgi:hypothetical protein